MNPLLYMAPIAVVVLVPATLLLEPNVAGITVALARKDVLMLLLFVNSTMAYFVNLTNFLVTKHTSALTLQVLGNAKGAVAVVVSILLFRNPVSVVGMVGYSLTVFGVFRYSEAKRRCKWSSWGMHCVIRDIILSFYFVCCCCSRCMQSSCCCCLIIISLLELDPLSFPQFTETSIWLYLRWKNQSVNQSMSFRHQWQTCLWMMWHVFLRWKNQSMSFRHWWTCLLMMDFVKQGERCREACEKVVDDGYFKQLLMSKHIRLCWDDGGGGAAPDCQDQILGFSFSDLSLAEEQILLFPIPLRVFECRKPNKLFEFYNCTQL